MYKKSGAKYTQGLALGGIFRGTPPTSKFEIICKVQVLTLVEAEKALLVQDPITAVIASLPIHPAAHTKPH